MTRKGAYYNEPDSFAAEWLRELIQARLIAPGDVDERKIQDVRGDDLRGYTQCHFFAGIGGWSYALRLAQWPDEQLVWTGSCPCQPFSNAGQRFGFADSRHLWPEFRRLIAECSPAIVFGEQVASNLGREWLAGVRADLERMAFAVGAADLCAAGVGAPHIRQRLYWMAYADFRTEGLELRSDRKVCAERPLNPQFGFGRSGQNGGRLAYPEYHAGNTRGFVCKPPQSNGTSATGPHSEFGRCSDVGWLASANQPGEHGRSSGGEQSFRHWNSAEYIPCIDGKFRRVPTKSEGELESALFPLAHGVRNRMGVLRGSGNAIVPQAAARFIRAGREAINDL